MPELLKELLIVCPLVFLAGFVDSVAGGGGLIAIPAYLLAGLPAQLAARHHYERPEDRQF